MADPDYRGQIQIKIGEGNFLKVGSIALWANSPKGDGPVLTGTINNSDLRVSLWKNDGGNDQKRGRRNQSPDFTP